MIGVPPVVERTEARHRASVCLCFLAPAGRQRVSLAAAADRNPPFLSSSSSSSDDNNFGGGVFISRESSGLTQAQRLGPR